MSEITIKTHDFEVAKQGLKEFSEQTTADLDLKKVDTSKGVGEWFGDWLKGAGIGTDHKVTGAEFNELTIQIQQHLIEINNQHERFIKEFGQVYDALEALDKDYIQAILISIKATEETSKGIEATQEQIKKIVEDQRKTLEILKKFKQKLDDYNHLQDIDNMWDEFQKWNKETEELSNLIIKVISNIKTNTQAIDILNENEKITNKKIDSLENDLNKQITKMETKEVINATIAEMEEKNNMQIKVLMKKIKVLGVVAGSSIGLTLITLLVIFMKVI